MLKYILGNQTIHGRPILGFRVLFYNLYSIKETKETIKDEANSFILNNQATRLLTQNINRSQH